MSYLTLVVLILFPTILPAQTSQKCNFEVTCENNFKLEFKSKSGDCSEDDTSIVFSNLTSSVNLSIKTAWFSEMANVGNNPSQCKSTNFTSYPIFLIKDRALLFLRQNGRPGWDIIVAVLLDSKNGKIVDQLEVGRYMRSTFGIIKTHKGFKMQMVNASLKEMNCDCDAAFVEKWMEVRIEKNKLFKAWL